MNILIIGTGYVGLTCAACFAEMGHHVICLDNDKQKIAQLHVGVLPIFEPGLKEIVERNVKASRLSFTTDYAESVKQSDVCFLAVPTPSNADGSCDLSYVYAASTEFAEHVNGYKVIVNKSTVPVGTGHQVKEWIAAVLKKRGVIHQFDVVSNPEFLKEGCAIHDCMKPDRIILGVENSRAEKIMRDLYSTFTINRDRIFVMDLLSSEMTKYAANAMLALRISFMNELSHLCEQTGADIRNVRIGIGSDQRIGYQFLYAGAGFGGSCFPKDIRALSSIARQYEVDMPILNSIDIVNERQKKLLPEKIRAYFAAQGGVYERTIAIWGLSFKPDTDDIREASSLSLIYDLLEEGAKIRAYDPVAIPNAKKLLGQNPRVQFCQDEYEAAAGADAIVLMTEWKQFRSVDFSKILSSLKHKVLFDGRNQYHLSEMQELGMEYFGVGVPSSRCDLRAIATSLRKKTAITQEENGYQTVFT
jgi:UDPglucose 6-dehydrogenase